MHFKILFKVSIQILMSGAVVIKFSMLQPMLQVQFHPIAIVPCLCHVFRLASIRYHELT